MRLLADSALTVQRGPSLARLEHQEVEKSLPEEPKIDTPLPNTASKVLSGGFNQSHTIHRQPVDFACPLKSLQQHRVLRKGAQLDRPSLAAAPAVENFSTHTACFSRQKIREDGIANFSYRHGAPLVDVHTHSCLCLYIPHRWCGHGQEVGDWFTIVYCQHCLSWPLPKHIQLDTSPWHMDSAASVHLSYVTALRRGQHGLFNAAAAAIRHKCYNLKASRIHLLGNDCRVPRNWPFMVIIHWRLNFVHILLIQASDDAKDFPAVREILSHWCPLLMSTREWEKSSVILCDQNLSIAHDALLYLQSDCQRFAIA
mmetsp:Transcript_83657/g.157487  ORF Transcript_83657/g.157487 Transcript_83657/m.157487 type:complete len:313 (+) Transcript_83657:493-1431(+)